jgi:hypothetical protein
VAPVRTHGDERALITKKRLGRVLYAPEKRESIPSIAFPSSLDMSNFLPGILVSWLFT